MSDLHRVHEGRDKGEITLDLAAGDDGPVYRAALPKAPLCASSAYFASMLDGGFREAVSDSPGAVVRVEVPPLAGATVGRLARFCSLLGGAVQPVAADIAFADALRYVGAAGVARACSKSMAAALDLWGDGPCDGPDALPGAQTDARNPVEPVRLAELAKFVLLAYAVRLRAEACDAPLDPQVLPRPRRLVFDASRFWERACAHATDRDDDGQPLCRRGDAREPLCRRQAWRVRLYQGLGEALVETARASPLNGTDDPASVESALAWVCARDDGGQVASLALALALRDWSRPLFPVEYAIGNGCTLVDPFVLPSDFEAVGFADRPALVSGRGAFERALVETFPVFGPLVVRDGLLHGGGVVLAGGSVVDAMQAPHLRAARGDLDMWIYGSDDAHRRRVFTRMAETIFAAVPGCRCVVSGSVASFHAPLSPLSAANVDDKSVGSAGDRVDGAHAESDQAHAETIQIVYTDCRSAAQVVAGFDMGHVCAYYDGRSVRATAECVWSIVARASRPLPGIVPRADRLAKARRKGFGALAPLATDPVQTTTTTTTTLDHAEMPPLLSASASAPSVMGAPARSPQTAPPDEIATRLATRSKPQECTDARALVEVFDFAPLLRNPYEFARRAAADVGNVPPHAGDDVSGVGSSGGSPPVVPSARAPATQPPPGDSVCARCGSADPRHEICAPAISGDGAPSGMMTGIVRRPRPIRLPLSRMMGNPACYRCSENSQRRKYKCTRQGTCAYLGAPSTPEQDQQDSADPWGYWPADQSVQLGLRQMAYRRARQARLCVSLALVSVDRDAPRPESRAEPSPVLGQLDALHAFLSDSVRLRVETVDGYNRGRGDSTYPTVARGTTEGFTRPIPRVRRWHQEENGRALAYVSRWSSFVDGLTGRPADPRDYPIGTLMGGTLALGCFAYEVGVVRPRIDVVAVRAYPPWFLCTAGLLDP
ncbi:epstein-barr virus nuclear antigen 3 incomplete domain containing protein [Pandoravirus japonicus]|uniref:Epstein-barr virus nuclear antigen 3 incomplete domain containing protein n=1 Tax=Pandoravirus japonicus TaxID=2823154 RepID=A0A811BSG7_9VIRU|nr:epstein-barr virus nuclear antigen 3 incomplete domain containing protein [Pandoravirus japonicus]